MKLRRGMRAAIVSAGALISVCLMIANAAMGQSIAESVPAGKITKTMKTDVVVVGAGFAGVCAALSAAENGVKVTVLEKGPAVTARGLENAAFNSQFQLSKGVKIDRNELRDAIMEVSGFRADEALVNLWIDKSGPALDWVTKMAVEGGLTPTIKDIPQGSTVKEFPVAIVYGGNMGLMKVLEKNARAKGVEFIFNTPAVQLVRQGNGPVTAVVAKGPDKAYIRLDAKAVVLATGGYESNDEMLKKYMPPSELRIRIWRTFTTKYNTGDGQDMATAVGAVMDEYPHLIAQDPGGLKSEPYRGGDMFFPAVPMNFFVNAYGKRFVPETIPSDYVAAAIDAQPGHFCWYILDNDWNDPAKVTITSPLIAAYRQATLNKVDLYKKNGDLLVANTFEELAAKMNVPVDVFVATVKHYNQYAKDGKDLEFGVPAKLMTPALHPPLFALNVANTGLVTLDGVKVNTDMQITDAAGKAIPALYAAGNVTGGMFYHIYPHHIYGMTHGRAITFGKLAGENAAKAAKAN